MHYCNMQKGQGPDPEAMEIASWILSSKYRTEIFLALAESARTPKSLKMQFKTFFSSVSKALRELKEKELVGATTQRTKLYYLTEKGQELLPQLRIILDREREAGV